MATEEEKKKAYEEEKKKAEQIFRAAAVGSVETLKQCVHDYLHDDYKQVLGYKDGNGRTPLHFAAHSGQVEMCKLLCEKCGIDWKIDSLLDGEGFSPLALAIRSGHMNVVNVFLDSGVVLDDKIINASIFFQAAGSGNVDVLRFLLNNGAGKYINDDGGAGTALHGATFARDPEAVKILLDAGADVNAVDSNGMTSLIVAAGMGSTVIVSELLKAKADISKAVNDGTTAFHAAASVGAVDVLKLLLEQSQKTDNAEILKAKNGHGQTAVEVAAESHQKGAAEMLFEESKRCGAIGSEFSNVDDVISTVTNAKDIALSELKRITKNIQERCNDIKDKGNSLFKEGKYEDALEMYTLAIKEASTVEPRILELSAKAGEDSKKELKSDVIGPLYANRCMSYMKLEQLQDAFSDAKKACELAPMWPKAKYRLGQCLSALDRHAEAAQAYWDGYQLNPKQSGANAMLKLFKSSVALGKKQAKAEKEGEKDNKPISETVVYDHKVPVEVPVPGSSIETKTLTLCFNDEETPAEIAGRFIRENKLDPSLLARIAHHVHTVMQQQDD